MKVIFLDVDGVLNCNTTKERIREPGYKGLHGVDATLRDRFLKWWSDKDVYLVLSSMWRYHVVMIGELLANGLQFIDQTDQSAAVWSPHVTRGYEIQQWLDAHPEVTHYAILDDNDWFKGEQRKHFVKTDPAVGLQDSDLAKLDKILYSDE